MNDPNGFAMPESIDQREFVIATYLYRTPRRRHPRGGPCPGRDAVDRDLGGARARDASDPGTPFGSRPGDLGGTRPRDGAAGVAWDPGLGPPDRLSEPQHRGPDPAPAGDGLRRVRLGRRDQAPRPAPARVIRRRVQGPEVRPRDPRARRRHGSAAAHHDDEAGARPDPQGERGGLLPGGHRRLGRREGRRAARLASVEHVPRPGPRARARPERRSRRPATGPCTSSTSRIDRTASSRTPIALSRRAPPRSWSTS